MRKAWNQGKVEWKSCTICLNKIRKWKKYCSRNCLLIGKKRRISKKCILCKNNFFVIPSKIKQKTCGRKCGRRLAGINRRGEKHFLFGKKRSEDVVKKISLGHIGILVGNKNPNWKGGICQKNKILRTKFHKKLRKKILERDNYTCQICDNRGGNLQVDHILSWATNEKLRFDMKNCRTLCQNCHYKETFGREMPTSVKTWGHILSQMK